LTIAFLDKVEEFRPLLAYESLFRTIIKTHIKNLLAMKKEYWRQRFTSRLVQFGDDNTKLFHAMASERYRFNVISQLMDDTGRMVADHAAKRALFFQESEEGLADLASPCNLTLVLSANPLMFLRNSASLSVMRRLTTLYWSSILTRPQTLMVSTTFS
jgi:hypothetical protein